MDTKFDMNVSKRMLLNAVTERVTAFSVFELLRENQVGEGVYYFLTFWFRKFLRFCFLITLFMEASTE